MVTQRFSLILYMVMYSSVILEADYWRNPFKIGIAGMHISEKCTSMISCCSKSQHGFHLPMRIIHYKQAPADINICAILFLFKVVNIKL